MSREYRLHDFFLGRRDCQEFLRSNFSLKIDNPLFDAWRNAPWATKYRIPAADDTQRWFELPIIPLVGAVATEEPEPTWPYQKFSPQSLEDSLKSRLDALFQRWLEGESILSKLAKAAWALWGRGFAATKVLNIVTGALAAQRLLPASKK